ncbi:LysR family transcriptional regulator [Roseivivax sp.]
MDNWDDLRFLVALARTGTMTAAAKMLGTNTATVSRRIERLSETLGEAAFVKTAHGWQPSSSVEKLIELAQTFDGELQTALNARASAGSDHVVPITIGSPPVITSQVLIPFIQERAADLAGIEITFNDRLIREGLGEHDVVVQFGAPEAGRIITRKAGALNFNLFRTVAGPQEGKGWIGLAEAFDETPVQKMALDAMGCDPVVRTENFGALYGLIKVTGLCGPLPDVMALNDPDLTYADPTLPSYEAEFWVMYHETRRSDPVMRRVVDWIMYCFSQIEGTQRKFRRSA